MAYRECDLREENNEKAKPLLRFFFIKGRRQLVVTSEPVSRDRDGCCVDGIVSEDGNRCERKARAASGR